MRRRWMTAHARSHAPTAACPHPAVTHRRVYHSPCEAIVRPRRVRLCRAAAAVVMQQLADQALSVILADAGLFKLEERALQSAHAWGHIDRAELAQKLGAA